jgi:hypothetical protein
MTVDYKSLIGIEDLNIGVGTFERRSSTGETLILNQIHLGDTGTAVPTTGTWPRGWIRWHSEPELGGFLGWVCTTAGTPGTWAEFGFISANEA